LMPDPVNQEKPRIILWRGVKPNPQKILIYNNLIIYSKVVIFSGSIRLDVKPSLIRNE